MKTDVEEMENIDKESAKVKRKKPIQVMKRYLNLRSSSTTYTVTQGIKKTGTAGTGDTRQGRFTAGNELNVYIKIKYEQFMNFI